MLCKRSAMVMRAMLFALALSSSFVPVALSVCEASHRLPAAGVEREGSCVPSPSLRHLGWVTGIGQAGALGDSLFGPRVCNRRSLCSRDRQAIRVLRMDAGDNSMGERVEAKKRARGSPGKLQTDIFATSSQLQDVADGIRAIPKIYNWTAIGLRMEDSPVVLNIPAPKTVAYPEPAAAPRDSCEEQRLLQEMERIQAEHKDINEISDRLGLQEMGGVPSIHIEPQRAALKKRKLMLKDQMAMISAKLTKLRGADARAQQLHQTAVTESLESEEDEEQVEQPHNAASEEAAKESLRRRLREAGLRPDAIPPHKDSFFLALMKGLQAAGLRPRDYDFREGPVMGSVSQFPWAAKRARQDVMALLSSQAHKLNGIGGWKLSAAEFKRYFSAAWWQVAAARHDLFMASAHLYSIRIICLSIVEKDGLFDLVEEVYDAPVGVGGRAPSVRATLTVCRRGMHVISTSPAKNSAAQRAAAAGPGASLVAPPAFLAEAERAKERAGEGEGRRGWELVGEEEVGVTSSRDTPWNSPLTSALTKEEEALGAGETEEDNLPLSLPLPGALLGSSLTYSNDIELVEDASYGSASAAEASEAWEALSEVSDDEVSSRPSGPSPRFPSTSLYEPQVATKRLFVTVVLKEHAAERVGAVVGHLRNSFPLDSKQLDAVVRWIQPSVMHITLQTLEVTIPRLEETQEVIAGAVAELGERAFNVSVSAADLGCFWRAAGSSWGRVPGVIWLGVKESGGLEKLVRIHKALEGACMRSGLLPDSRPFCAHITLGKSKGADKLSTHQRRTLRAFGKWMQDQERPVNLQELLNLDASQPINRRNDPNPSVQSVQRRGNKRHKSWLAGGGHSKSGRGPHRGSRDIGALNAQLARDVALQGDGGGAGAEGNGGHLGITVEVDSLHVMEAVRERGSKHISYHTLLEIPLARAPRAESAAATAATASTLATSSQTPPPSPYGWMVSASASSSTLSRDRQAASLAQLLAEDSDSD